MRPHQPVARHYPDTPPSPPAHTGWLEGFYTSSAGTNGRLRVQLRRPASARDDDADDALLDALLGVETVFGAAKRTVLGAGRAM